MKIRIQPRELKDGTLPYPYFIEKDGLIGRQDFWQGKPYKLVGFSEKPTAGKIDLFLGDFWRHATLCIRMYPVFVYENYEIFTSKNDIKEVEIIREKRIKK